MHCSIIVTLLMQVITVSAENHVTLCSVDASFLSKVDSKDVKITLVKNF